MEKKLIIGAKVKIGEEYAKEIGGLIAGQEIELIEGVFEYDNGLYDVVQTAPSIFNEKQKDFDSIYHLFGNDFEHFMDCKIITQTINTHE